MMYVIAIVAGTVVTALAINFIKVVTTRGTPTEPET